MKKLFLLLLFIVPVLCYAQTDTAGYTKKEAFCIIQVYPVGSKYEIILDDGTKKRTRDMDVKDEKGNKIKFDSVIGVLDYATRLGWTFTSSYSSVSNGSSYSLCFVFKRKL